MKIQTVKEYIASPHSCPFCHSENIEAQHWDGDIASQPIVCLHCGRQWIDIYKLVAIGFENPATGKYREIRPR